MAYAIGDVIAIGGTTLEVTGVLSFQMHAFCDCTV